MTSLATLFEDQGKNNSPDIISERIVFNPSSRYENTHISEEGTITAAFYLGVLDVIHWLPDMKNKSPPSFPFARQHPAHFPFLSPFAQRGHVSASKIMPPRATL